MPRVVTINRPDVIALIEEAAGLLTSGNKTEAVALAMRGLLARQKRTGTLFGFMAGTVRIPDDFDLLAPVFQGETDAETGAGINR